jgi:cation:H+ antiporter
MRAALRPRRRADRHLEAAGKCLMTAAAIVWFKFAICAGLITYAGPALARYGDIIAEKTGLSRTWIGLVLLATATSLPELFTGISAVTFAAAPNIAVGNILGACVINLAMLVVLDTMTRGETIYRRMDQGHILSAAFAVILIGFAGASVLVGRNEVHLELFHIGAYTPLFISVYLVAMRSAFLFEQRKPPQPPIHEEAEGMTLGTAIRWYIGAAAIIAGVGTWLPFIGTEMAEVMDLKTSFVGTLFIAAATTLPEFVVTLSALRLGALDLAIGNLLGSNLFNILILAIDDIAYLDGPLLSAVSPVHAVTAFAAVTMLGIVIVALLYRPTNRLWGTIGWVSLSLLTIYLLSTFLVYLEGH